MAMQGRNTLLRWLARMPQRTRDALARATQTEASRIVGKMRLAAPVDEGVLVASIKATAQAGGARQKITAGGATTMVEARKGSGEMWDYALGVEFGVRPHRLGGFARPKLSTRLKRALKGGGRQRHPGQAAQPFFYPTWRAARRGARSAMTRAVKKSLTQGASGG